MSIHSLTASEIMQVLKKQPLSVKEIAYKLRIHVDTARKYLSKLHEDGEIKVIQRKPLTFDMS